MRKKDVKGENSALDEWWWFSGYCFLSRVVNAFQRVLGDIVNVPVLSWQFLEGVVFSKRVDWPPSAIGIPTSIRR